MLDFNSRSSGLANDLRYVQSCGSRDDLCELKVSTIGLLKLRGFAMVASDGELLKLRDRLRVFAADRNWDQFHNPKNLAMALIAEAGELVEPFQWLTEEQSKHLATKQLLHVQEEVADVFIYLVRLADKLGIDLIESANKKIDLNNERYPVSEAYGNAEKSKHSR